LVDAGWDDAKVVQSDHERLTETLRQPLTYQARRDVRTASGREANNDAHRPRGIGLRPRDPQYGRHRGCAGGQMQEFAAGKFHFEPPFTSSDHLVGKREYTPVRAWT